VGYIYIFICKLHQKFRWSPFAIHELLREQNDPERTCVAVCCSVMQCVAVCCRVLQCVAVCCSVLQYVAVCCSALRSENAAKAAEHDVDLCVVPERAQEANSSTDDEI